MSSSKCVERSKDVRRYCPDWVNVIIRSAPEKAPSSKPRSSVFSRWTVSSYQILNEPRVEIPSCRCSIFLTANFVSVFPIELRPLMAISAKLKSKEFFFRRGFGFNSTRTTSASPFGLAVKYNTFDPGVPLVTIYSLSLVTPSTLKRLTMILPFFPSR